MDQIMASEERGEDTPPDTGPMITEILLNIYISTTPGEIVGKIVMWR